MKRIVNNEIGWGFAVAISALIVVAVTDAGVAATYLIITVFLAIVLAIHEPPPRIQRWLQRRRRA